MENERVFKSQLFGFDKKDVLDYIDSASKTAMEAEQSLNDKLNALSEEKQSLRNQLDAFESKMQNLENRLSEEKDVIDKLTGKVSELNDVIRQKNDIIDRKNREFEIELAEKKRLRNAAAELEEKSKKYDEVATRIGNVLLAAEQNAAAIVDKAQENAAALNKETDDSAQHFDRELSDLKKDIFTLKDTLHQTLSTIEFQLDALNDSIDQTKERLGAYTKESEEKNIVIQMKNNRSEQISKENLVKFF